MNRPVTKYGFRLNYQAACWYMIYTQSFTYNIFPYHHEFPSDDTGKYTLAQNESGHYLQSANLFHTQCVSPVNPYYIVQLPEHIHPSGNITVQYERRILNKFDFCRFFLNPIKKPY